MSYLTYGLHNNTEYTYETQGVVYAADCGEYPSSGTWTVLQRDSTLKWIFLDAPLHTKGTFYL